MGNHDRPFATYGSVIKTVKMGITVYFSKDLRVSEAALSESEYFIKNISDPSHPLYFMTDETVLFMFHTVASAF